MNKTNVLQHQFAILKGMTKDTYLATKGVATCTAWYGWDKDNDVVFLAHFDRPGSAHCVPRMLNLMKEKVPSKHQLESILIGGKSWCWSPKTRKYITDYVDVQSDINITIEPMDFENHPFQSTDITLFNSSGLVAFDELEGRIHPRGVIGWFLGPMKDVSKEIMHVSER